MLAGKNYKVRSTPDFYTLTFSLEMVTKSDLHLSKIVLQPPNFSNSYVNLIINALSTINLFELSVHNLVVK